MCPRRVGDVGRCPLCSETDLRLVASLSSRPDLHQPVMRLEFGGITREDGFRHFLAEHCYVAQETM